MVNCSSGIYPSEACQVRSFCKPHLAELPVEIRFSRIQATTAESLDSFWQEFLEGQDMPGSSWKGTLPAWATMARSVDRVGGLHLGKGTGEGDQSRVGGPSDNKQIQAL